MASTAGNRAAFGSSAVWTDKGKVGRSTPDSDALASSEDEHDLSQSTGSAALRANAPVGQPRRSSFLSEIKSGDQRKGSIAGCSLPSNPSQPTTPSGEHNPWAFGATLGRVASNGSSGVPWAQTGSIWGPERRDIPIRVNEVSSPLNHPPLPSPVATETTDYFPYNIPLQPVLKTHRSQSYSVGQMEAELGPQSPGAVGTPTRPRPGVAATHYRPMRPSTLGEAVYIENRPLGQLNEVEDDDASDQGVLLASPKSRQEQLSDVTNNTLLRQATHENARSKHGSATLGAVAAEEARRSIISPLSPDRSTHPVADSAIEDDETEQVYAGRTSGHLDHPATQDNNHRSMWTTSLGFGMDEIPQSRRHSLADIPTRRGSLVGSMPGPPSSYHSVASAYANMPHALEVNTPSAGRDFRQTPLDMEMNMNELDVHNRAYAHTYFSGAATANRSRQETSGLVMAHTLAAPYSQPSPAGNMFGRPGSNVPLYIVTFKCSRAGIFYVQEGTGLQVNEGDLVIVEADRGQDLGTVAHARIDFNGAREAMEKAADEHYKWLMMFSRHNLTIADSENRGLMASAGSDQANPHGDSSPVPGMHDMAGAPQETSKPKMIKRLAQNHEIATLREKEGNEAKAKRICQQKANEHNLKMEILDAEFQVDWKKLTFYFYSTEYINFNLLVGDLFKIYKTRIWLSAINPAAFRSRPNQPPSAIGPGAVQGRSSAMNPAASAFNAGFNGNGLSSGPSYNDDITGAIPPPSYRDSGFGLPQNRTVSGGLSPLPRQPIYSPAGNDASHWYVPSAGFAQQYDSVYGGSPPPIHDSGFHPGMAFGQVGARGMRNGVRQVRSGTFGPPRQVRRE